jgi:phosphatidylserine synthase
MISRRGERIGWIGGWMGGFIWVLILSIVLLMQGKIEQGIVGIILVDTAIFAILYFSPWRFPSTEYWKLMLAPYGVFWLSILWAIWAYGGLSAVGLNWWNLLWLLPMMVPFGVLSKRKWSDSDQQDTPADTDKPHY